MKGEKIEVRVATPEDVHEVMDMGLRAHKEIAISRSNPQRLLQDVWPALNRDGGIIGVIGKPGGRLEGLTMLKIETLSYGDEPFLVEKVVYVRPEFRTTHSYKGGRGRKLCEFAKEVSETLGLPLLIGISTTVETKAKVDLYERIFGPSVGSFFCYGRRHHSEARQDTDNVAVAAE